MKENPLFHAPLIGERYECNLCENASGFMSVSCHIRRVEIVVELGIFVFF